MKKFLIVWLSVLFVTFNITNVFGQNFSTTTYYSKFKNGRIGPDEKNFSFSNGYMYKTDKYYGTTITYGPFIFRNSGYVEDGFYVEYFAFDIKSYPLESIKTSVIGYYFNYDVKGGKLLSIMEFYRSDNYQVFYTEEGYKYTHK